MSSAAPVAQNPAHEKVNAFGLRSELSDTTAGAHRSFGFSLRASEGVAGPIGVPSITGGGGWRAAPGVLGLTRVSANHGFTAGLKRRSWRWRHKSLNPNIPFLPLLLPECCFLFWKTTSDPGKHTCSDTWDTAAGAALLCLDSCCLCFSAAALVHANEHLYPPHLPQHQGLSSGLRGISQLQRSVLESELPCTPAIITRAGGSLLTSTCE